MASELIWRFLVVDDKQADEVEEFIAGNRVLDTPDKVVVEKCQKFTEAIKKLEDLRIDLVILDLKDDSIALEDDETPFAGEKVFEQVRQRRFIPVVFYTAYAHKVKHLENPFVRVVSRDEPTKLRDVIKEVFETRLPRLLKHLEEEQRNYMWDHVQTHWHDSLSSYEKTDITYLLARRLANTLERGSVRRFLAKEGTSGPEESDKKIYPIEMYIYPPTNPFFLAGDIFNGSFTENDNKKKYWVLLTPSCDLEQGKAEKILLAECISLEELPEYESVRQYWREVKKAKEESSGTQPKQTPVKKLKQMFRDNRQGQSERYKFLPGTFFLPDLLIDFQSLVQIAANDLSCFDRIASLDSPFSEACLAKFTRYYGRLGTPDLDIDFVYERFEQKENSR